MDQLRDTGMEKIFLLPESVLNNIIDYLASRPFKEVVGGIAALQKLQQYNPPKDDAANQKAAKAKA